MTNTQITTGVRGLSAATTGYQADTARIVFESLSPNTRRAYQGALTALDEWLAGQPLTDQAMTEYLQARYDAGASPATCKLAVAAVKWWTRAMDAPNPVDQRTTAKIKALSEAGSGRGRGQARPLTYDGAIAILATACSQDRAIVALLFMAGLRRSEAAALTWGDIEDTGAHILVHVATSKTNRAGETTDIRLVKNGFADAIRAIRPDNTEDSAPVIGLKAQRIGQRFTAAAKAAGVSHRVTAHSGRVGLASELTHRGASTTETMLAGNWKTSRMVAHYAAGARAERGAVAKFF